MNHIERLKDKLLRKQNEIEENDRIIRTLESEIRRIQRSIINTEDAINGNNLQGRDKYALKPKLKQLNNGKAVLVSESLRRRNKGGILRRQFQQLNKEYEDATTDPISIRA